MEIDMPTMVEITLIVLQNSENQFLILIFMVVSLMMSNWGRSANHMPKLLKKTTVANRMPVIIMRLRSFFSFSM